MFDKEYVFHGKHAEMVDELMAKLSDDINAGFFSTVYDVYRVAPLIGYAYKRTAQVDRSSDRTKKIFYDKIAAEKDELVFNYRTLMILLNKDKSDEEKLKIAFKLDEQDEDRKEYDNLYNSYVLGGLEELHEQIFKDGKTADDYRMNLFNFLTELNFRLYGTTDVQMY